MLISFNFSKKTPRIIEESGADGGIRTHEPIKANAFRVRPVMTTSIRLQINYRIILTNITAYVKNFNVIKTTTFVIDTS